MNITKEISISPDAPKKTRIAQVATLAVALAIPWGCAEEETVDEIEELRMYNWWTTGGELAALDAILTVFTGQHPNVQVTNAVTTGGAGLSQQDLVDDLESGNAPDTFVIHIGDELEPQLAYLQNLDDVFASEGWANAFPQGVLDSVTFDGHYYAVPINIHRSNVLFYRKDLVSSPPTSVEDLLVEVAAGKKFAFVGEWTAMHIFESVLLAKVGTEGWPQLFDGTIGWDSDLVKGAFTDFKALIDASTQSIDPAEGGWGERLIALMTDEVDPAAFTIMGDWFVGDMKVAGLVAGTDFGWAPSPGTDQFMYLADSFVLTADAPNAETTKKLLKVIGSVEGQDAFNPIKGSIPARVDSDVAKYDTYGESAISDFASPSTVLIPSMAHGAKGHPNYKGAMFGILQELAEDTITVDEASAKATACFASGTAGSSCSFDSL